jgi:hypothetical protein
MTYLQTLPFTYTHDSRAGGEIETYEFFNVEFYEDFGVYKKGEKYSSLEMDLDGFEIRAYDEHGQVVLQTIEIVMQPVADN